MTIAQVNLNGSFAVVQKLGNGAWRTIDSVRDMTDVMNLDAASRVTAYDRGQIVNPQPGDFLAPVTRPGKIIAIGRNYAEHAQEQRVAPPTHPLIFAKLPSSITNPDGVIEWDPSLATEVDYEAELAVIIGTTARRGSPQTALSPVFGYTCANDVTARDLQNKDGQWTRAKGLDTFCPLGPWIVTADEIPNPQRLAIRCDVNGTRLQDSNTEHMIFDVKTLIAHTSAAFTLHPGDIILTGTPGGIGHARTPPILLREGDSVVVEIEGIGRLENTCHETSVEGY